MQFSIVYKGLTADLQQSSLKENFPTHRFSPY